MKEVIIPADFEQARGMIEKGGWSPAVRVGNVIYVSAIGAEKFDEHGRLVIAGKSIEAQTRVIMERLKEILEKAGGSLSSLVDMTIFLRPEVNFQEAGEVDRVIRGYFDGPGPAVTWLQVEHIGLEEELLVIKATAVVQT